MMDRVDRYIGRVFWSSYGVTFLFFYGMFFVLDFFSTADDFFSTASNLQVTPWRMIGRVAAYYLYNTPAVFLQIAPFVTVIGVIVTIARLARQNELVPILMSGRSVFRMLRPIFVYGMLLTIGMICIQELVAPRVASRRIALREYLRDGEHIYSVNQGIEDIQGNTWFSMQYNMANHRLVKAWVSRSLTEGVTEFGPIEDAYYDEARRGWTIEGPAELRTDQMQAPRKVRFIESSMTPRQVEAKKREAFDLSLKELGELAATTGQQRFTVLFHYHITFPVTNVLLILLAVPFVMRYDKRSVYIGLAVAFLLCGAYFAVDFGFRALGEKQIHPVLAAWFSPIFFGALGISLFDGIRT